MQRNGVHRGGYPSNPPNCTSPLPPPAQDATHAEIVSTVNLGATTPTRRLWEHYIRKQQVVMVEQSHMLQMLGRDHIRASANISGHLACQMHRLELHPSLQNRSPAALRRARCGEALSVGRDLQLREGDQ